MRRSRLTPGGETRREADEGERERRTRLETRFQTPQSPLCTALLALSLLIIYQRGT